MNMIEFNLSAICEIQRRLDYNHNHGGDGRFISGNDYSSGSSGSKKGKRGKRKTYWLDPQEYAEVYDGINSEWHIKYQGKRTPIHTMYDEEHQLWKHYYFENYGFNNYNIYDVVIDDEE